MTSSTDSEIEPLLAYIDFEAIADPGDKIMECEFFLALASTEQERCRFRWLISAYLNAVYSYFETTALDESVAFTDPTTGDPVEDSENLEKLRAYVKVQQSTKNPYFVKTSAVHPAIVRLYSVRKAATHHVPLAIMAAGPNLPEDYHLGSTRGTGDPLLALCREALVVVKRVHAELNE